MKITDYGLFVRIDSEIDGLVHLSEITNSKEKEPDITDKYEIGKTYAFRIISFDPDAHRLGLSLKLEPDEIEVEEEKKEKKTKAKLKKEETKTLGKTPLKTKIKTEKDKK